MGLVLRRPVMALVGAIALDAAMVAAPNAMFGGRAELPVGRPARLAGAARDRGPRPDDARRKLQMVHGIGKQAYVGEIQAIPRLCVPALNRPHDRGDPAARDRAEVRRAYQL